MKDYTRWKDYNENWKKYTYECSRCGWSGIGEDAKQLRACVNLFYLHCPRCNFELAGVSYPRTPENLPKRIKPENEYQALIQTREQFLRALQGQWLGSPEQLPDIEGDHLIFIWDDEEREQKRDLVIRYGAKTVWREPCFFGCFSRYEAITNILKQKYGARLKDLIPTRWSCIELAGNRIEIIHNTHYRFSQ